jgi:lambda repressor-like predicted transcriptional regulator
MDTPTRISVVDGPVGTVTGLYETIQAALEASGSGWEDLARSLGVSRQYLTRVLREPKIPLDRVLEVCRAVGLRAEDVITPTRFVRALVAPPPDGSASPGGGLVSSEVVDELEEQLASTTARLKDRNRRCAELERELGQAHTELSSRGPTHTTDQDQHFTF